MMSCTYPGLMVFNTKRIVQTIFLREYFYRIELDSENVPRELKIEISGINVHLDGLFAGNHSLWPGDCYEVKK